MPSTCCINQDLVACSVLWTARFPRSIGLRPSFALGKHSQTQPFKRHSTLFYIIQSRAAARKELLNQADSPDECEKLYEQSLWCLYALQDELLQVDNPFMDEDRNTITTCKFQYVIHLLAWMFICRSFVGIKRTKLRLIRCRVRMGMNERDRLKDARLDKNLDDVPRDPPPWEIGQSEDNNPTAPRP